MDTTPLEVSNGPLVRRAVTRRIRTLAEKIQIVAEANTPGASVAEVARRHGVNANLVFNWCRQHRRGALERHTRRSGARLLAVKVTDAAPPRTEPAHPPTPIDEGRIEIDLAGEVRIAIIGAVPTERIVQVLSMLRRAS